MLCVNSVTGSYRLNLIFSWIGVNFFEQYNKLIIFTLQELACRGVCVDGREGEGGQFTEWYDVAADQFGIVHRLQLFGG